MRAYLAVVILFAGAGLFAEDPAPKGLVPPARPAHADKRLETATELAKDLAETVTYLEHGQAFFRAYQKGTHTAEENAAFLEFLKAYEAEHAAAKREAEALAKWVKERGSLDAAAEP